MANNTLIGIIRDIMQETNSKKININTILKYIYLAIFLGISLTPMILYCVFFVAGNSSSLNIEKAEVVSFPSIYTNKGINDSFDDECETWINQNIPFRGILLSYINIGLSDFLKEPVSNVVAGRNDFIYSTETLSDYMDTNAMSPAEIKSIGITLSLIQERVENSNGRFLFVPVPNKNSIYPEYMPARFIKSSDNNLGRVYNELKSVSVNYIDLRTPLLDAKNDDEMGPLYYKRDTHWTVYGALIGYNNIMEGLGKTPLSYGGHKIEADTTRRSDLDKMLFPMVNRVEKEYLMDTPVDYEGFEFINPSEVADTKAQLENFMSDLEDNDNNFKTKKRKPLDNSTLYMVRDSFGRALLPFMIDSFNEATFVRTVTPSIEKSVACTDVVYEICERNLKNVIASAPYMYAPLRENFRDETDVYESRLNTCYFEDEGYAYRVYGTIDSNMAGEDGRIYVKLVDEKSQTKVFEAFPIYEESLMSEYSNTDGGKIRGYSLYLNKTVLGTCSYEAQIISGTHVTDVLATIKEDNNSDKIKTNEEFMTVNPYGDENGLHQLVYRDGTVGIGDNINNLIPYLGNQAAPSEIITSCLSGVDSVVYYYPNITIETDMEGNIYYISLMDNSYGDGNADAVTKGGITIGTDKMNIWDKVGTPERENDKNCVFQTEHISVTYSYKSGKVTAIILEDRKYKNDSDVFIESDVKALAGFEYEHGNTYLYDEEHNIQTGWYIIDDEYYFFDRLTGERIVGQNVDGIEIGPDGEVNLSQYDKDKIEMMMKAHTVMVQVTEPSDTMEEKRRKVFDWIMSFPYHKFRSIKGIYNDEGFEILEANDIFENSMGDCVSESAALAFLFHEIGYNDVYFCHDTGHSWVRSEDKLFDPLFAEARSFEDNYNAEFKDYRKTMDHVIKIY